MATEDPTAAISLELDRFVHSKSSTFACGGSIQVRDALGVSDSTSDSFTCPPFALRWDTSDSVEKLVFPVTDEAGEAQLAKLLQTCEPATFGYKGENVLDETYRKATKLDRSAFSSDFCPYEHGIIDAIAQMLLPNASYNHENKTSGVRAELYKLNIYGSPSGFFKSHVDTPRSETQFGSLVVSLPCRHEGGQLIVRHAGHETVFDWSLSKIKANAICWAAFYSDCEHEVKEITEGNRVTLTYNLYFAPGVGDLAENCPAMDITTLPLYQKVEQALANPEFMENGGYFGIFCSHAYAHNTKVGAMALPAILKGSDMAVYTVFRAHGLKVWVRPVLEDSKTLREQAMYDESSEGSDEESDNHDNAKFRPYNRLGRLGEVYVRDYYDEGETMLETLNAWANCLLDVKWLSTPNPDLIEQGFVFMTYGNEAGVDEMYAYAAMLVEVPEASKRLDKGGRPKAEQC